MKKILMLFLVAVVVSACKKYDHSDPSVDGEFTKLKKYVIYDTEKMKTNYGTDCPSRKKGRCIYRIEDNYVSVGNEVVVSMGLYDDNCLFVAVDGDYKEDKYVVEQDWIIWDKKILENFNLKEPVLIKAGKYGFYKDRNNWRYALLPLNRANLKERTVVFVGEKEWRAEYFYEGYLGECSALTGVVESFAAIGQLRMLLPYSSGELVLRLPYENNVADGGKMLKEIVESGVFVVEDDVYVNGLDVKVTNGEYEIEKIPEGVRVVLKITEL